MNNLKQSADKFLDSTVAIEDLTGRELEEARAYFQEKKNSRRVRQINEVLRNRLLTSLGR